MTDRRSPEPDGLCTPADARAAARRGFPGDDAGLRAALEEGAPGTPALVGRLDREGDAYYLVPFHRGDRLCAVVEVDARRCEVIKAGAVTGAAADFLLPPDRALAAARKVRPGIPDDALARLVWRPCRESFDSFCPLWAISHAAGVVFVDQSSGVHDRLHTDGRGGGPDGR